jgi:hypothetical protein
MGAAFQTAARREHEIERAALAAQHEVEVKERAAMLVSECASGWRRTGSQVPTN